MISFEEHAEIKEFLQYRVIGINQSENLDRRKQREKKSKYSQPDANSFGWIPALTFCYSFDIGNGQILYMIPFLPFYNFLKCHLPQALYRHSDSFGTGNAEDVILATYDISRYSEIGSIDDYKQSLIDNAHCYFLLRNTSGEISNRIFRLDLFRHILPNDKKSCDFEGGLMHAFCHCSWKGMKLSSGNGEIELDRVWDLSVMLGKAILTDSNTVGQTGKVKTTFDDGDQVWQISYHIDPDTRVRYLITAFAKSLR